MKYILYIFLDTVILLGVDAPFRNENRVLIPFLSLFRSLSTVYFCLHVCMVAVIPIFLFIYSSFVLLICAVMMMMIFCAFASSVCHKYKMIYSNGGKSVKKNGTKQLRESHTHTRAVQTYHFRMFYRKRISHES